MTETGATPSPAPMGVVGAEPARSSAAVSLQGARAPGAQTARAALRTLRPSRPLRPEAA